MASYIESFDASQKVYINLKFHWKKINSTALLVPKVGILGLVIEWKNVLHMHIFQINLLCTEKSGTFYKY